MIPGYLPTQSNQSENVAHMIVFGLLFSGVISSIVGALFLTRSKNEGVNTKMQHRTGIILILTACSLVLFATIGMGIYQMLSFK